ncbi:hypothetical protein ACWPKO_03380 [Coraliomargarita sp. W4R53]
MKQILLLLIISVLMLQIGCETTKNFSYESQQQYKNVLIISSIGDKVTANKTKNNLLAIQNEVYSEPLGEKAFVEEIEDYIQEALASKTPFETVTMHDFYPSNQDDANKIFSGFMRYKNVSTVLRKHGFDAVIFVKGERTLQGHPYDGIDKIYDEVGVYKEGDKNWFFTHFTLSFLDAEGDYEFAENKLKRILHTTTALNWESSEAPWKEDELNEIVKEAITLTKEHLDIAIQERFFAPTEI